MKFKVILAFVFVVSGCSPAVQFNKGQLKSSSTDNAASAPDPVTPPAAPPVTPPAAPPPVVNPVTPPAVPPVTGPAVPPVTIPTPPIVHFPEGADAVYAAAYEDHFPKAGDADYNDFLTNFHVAERFNQNKQITQIIVDFYPRAVGAGYDHEFRLILNGIKDNPTNITLKTQPLFVGDADISLFHYSPDGALLDQTNRISQNHDIVIFASSHAIFPPTKNVAVNTEVDQPYVQPLVIARVVITLHSPEKNPAPDTLHLDYSRLRMILHVKNTNQDIDLVDADPTNFDSNGYPFGFVIPTSWRWMAEGNKIDTAYPSFSDYRAYLLARAVVPNVPASPAVINWFLAPDPAQTSLYPAIPPLPLLPIN
jgi:LruC domain-containing protein